MTAPVFVPSASIAMMCVSLLLCFGVPVALFFILRKGRRGVSGAFFAGMLGFYIPQAVIRIPALQALGLNPAFQAFARDNAVLYAFLLAVTAGLFETTGRLLVFKLLLKDRYSYMAGLAAGAGHGSIEAILLVGLANISNLYLSFNINSGSSAALSGALPADTLKEAVDALTGTPPYAFALGGVERVFTIALHIALSVMLMSFVLRGRSFLGFVLVALVHTGVDFTAVLLGVLGVPVLWIEAVVFVIAAASVWYLVKARRTFGGQVNIPEDAAEKAVREGY